MDLIKINKRMVFRYPKKKQRYDLNAWPVGHTQKKKNKWMLLLLMFFFYPFRSVLQRLAWPFINFEHFLFAFGQTEVQIVNLKLIALVTKNISDPPTPKCVACFNCDLFVSFFFLVKGTSKKKQKKRDYITVVALLKMFQIIWQLRFALCAFVSDATRRPQTG